MFDSVRPHRWQPTRLPCPWDSPGKNTRVGCHFLLQCMKVKSESEVAQSCPTLSDPMDCSPPGSSIHGLFQARVLEWVAIAFSEVLYYQIRFLPLQGSCLENLRDRGAWWAAIYGVTQSRTQLKQLSSSRLIIAFLPRSKCLLILWLQSPSAVILESCIYYLSPCLVSIPLEPWIYYISLYRN